MILAADFSVRSSLPFDRNRNDCGGDKFYGTITAESQQRRAASHPRCQEGYNSLDAHPCNRDCLNLTNALERNGCRDWQYGIHR